MTLSRIVEKRERGGGKKGKITLPFARTLFLHFIEGFFEGLNRGQLRAIDKVSSGDARRLATRRKWCGSTSEPAHVHRRARHESWPPTESRTASPRASSRHALPSFLPPDRSSPVNYPSFCHSG